MSNNNRLKIIRKITEISILVGFPLYIIWDIIAVLIAGHDATLSDVTGDWAAVYQAIIYAAGMIPAHMVMRGKKAAEKWQIWTMVGISTAVAIWTVIAYYTGWRIPAEILFYGGTLVGRFLWTQANS